MILSEGRQTHLAHLITDGLWNDDLVDFTDDDEALRAAKRAVIEFVKLDQEVSQFAKDKVQSLKRNVMEGTPEWEILYQKYYETNYAFSLNERGIFRGPEMAQLRKVYTMLDNNIKICRCYVVKVTYPYP